MTDKSTACRTPGCCRLPRNRLIRVLLAIVLFALVGVTFARAAWAEEPLFPFVITYDAPDTLPDLSETLHTPAGKHGRIRAVDGRLVNDAGPVRFWGTNLCFDACCPDHQAAERLAERLAWLGINCVRFHHMDARTIWGNQPNKTTIDPDALDRLDYLVAQLKLRGIYSNLNLHVSRWLGEAEGFPHRDRRPKYDKGLGNFEPRMIALQKKYARDLLTHRNPYTGLRYANDPAVAFVEISNEDSLFTVWNWGELNDLPEPYAGTFRGLWNAWLEEKYGSTARLRDAWESGSTPRGEEMLQSGDFNGPWQKHWQLGRDAATEAHMEVQPKGAEGRPCLRMVVVKQGDVSWHPQLIQGGFAVEKGKAYTLSFRARSKPAKSIGVNCMMAHAPWDRLGLSADVELDNQWREHRLTFVAQRDDPDARITFTSLQPSTYELANVSLRPGGVWGLRPDESLEAGNVAVLPRDSLARTPQARRDFVDFLFDTERHYWLSMYRYLKDELGVEALVSGTQLSYSPVTTQAQLDYIDAHAYWSHPHFPNRPWDRRDWWVLDRAMVNHPGGTLESLAARRVLGKAFTVSEYNHPFPNRYAAEGFPMLASMAALQAWDGVLPFTYSHNEEFEPEKLTSYFDIKADPTRLAHMPACVALFVRGDLKPGEQLADVALWPEKERTLLYETLSTRSITADRLGLPEHAALRHRVGMRLVEGPPADGAAAQKAASASPDTGDGFESAEGESTDEPRRFVSDTGQMVWDVSRPDAGYFTVDTPRTKLFTGFVGGRTFRLGSVELQIGPTRLDWATVSMVCRDGAGFDSPGRILVAATGWMQNTGAVPESRGGDRITLGARWGEGPVLCEGIAAEIVLPVSAERVTVYPLDAAGARRPKLATESRRGRAVARLSPKAETLWYEIEIGR